MSNKSQNTTKIEDLRPATRFGTPDQCSRAISAEADRLYNNHRVILLGPGKALVIDGHDTYHAIKPSNRWSRDYVWERYKSLYSGCSQIVAVLRATKKNRCQAPAARLAEILHNTLNSMEVA